MSKPNPDDLLSSTEAAALKGLTTRSLQRHAMLGHLPAQQVGKSYVFRRADVEAFTPQKQGWTGYHASKKAEDPEAG